MSIPARMISRRAWIYSSAIALAIPVTVPLLGCNNAGEPEVSEVTASKRKERLEALKNSKGAPKSKADPTK